MSDPLWYKDAVIYEVHVRAFADSNGDGIGDFAGLTSRLDYLRDLGVTAIWLLPFYPSPLRDDGYDIADYKSVHPDYGTLDDFRTFLAEAHKRRLKVITELVINHTSDRHPWFQRARRAEPGSPERDFYVWSDTPDRYQDARIIFSDTEESNWAWDPSARAYYWHRFFSHQPDLNYENPAVRDAIYEVLDFWLDLGVDGLRLDAVPYLYEEEGTMSENLPRTHDELKRLRAHIDGRYEERMLLAEANQWPEEASAYFGDGDECHMAFHFPLMPRLFMSISMENRFPIIDILDQTPPIAATAQWAIFLRNHDELTLEMVTDEERDYMYRTYARDRRARLNLGIRRRLAPLLGNDRRKIELMNALLLSLPGTPVLYYGDEIGMGDNIYLGDRNGVRTPMHWSSDRNAGFGNSNSQQLYYPVIVDSEYHYETINVDAQQRNPNSLLWWTRRMLALRRQHQVFGRGSIEFLNPENPKVLTFVRSHADEQVLVVANLSRHNQYVELDLSPYVGTRPLELMGRSHFPDVAEAPFPMTLGPHGFFWFLLEPAELTAVPEDQELLLDGGLAELTHEERGHLEWILGRYLPTRVWFHGRGRNIGRVAITDVVSLPGELESVVLVADVQYTEGEPESYLMPLALALGEEAGRIQAELPDAVVARAGRHGEAGVLLDPIYEPGFALAMLAAAGQAGELHGWHGQVRVEGRSVDLPLEDMEITASDSPAGHTTVTFGQAWAVKVMRRAEGGVNPDLELRRFLTDRTDWTHVPPVIGYAEYSRDHEEPSTMAILQEYVPHQGDAWELFQSELSLFYEEVAAIPPAEMSSAHPRGTLLDLVTREPHAQIAGVIETERQAAELLGNRTAGLHLALASCPDGEEFCPEPFTRLYQRSVYQSVRSSTRQILHNAARRLRALDGRSQELVGDIVSREDEVLERLGRLLERRVHAKRIRIQGDYRLDQVLSTGNDFVVFDFAGDATRPLSQRRLKQSPLRDVAGMLRSLHYAAYVALYEEGQRGAVPADKSEDLRPWAQTWYAWVGAAFLRGYLEGMVDSDILPQDPAEGRALLQAFLLEKAVRELRWELDHRLEWIHIPVLGIQEILEHGH